MMPKTLLQIPCGYSMPFFLRINVHYITPCLKIRFTLLPIQIWLFVSFPSNGIQMPVKRKSMFKLHLFARLFRSNGTLKIRKNGKQRPTIPGDESAFASEPFVRALLESISEVDKADRSELRSCITGPKETVWKGDSYSKSPYK